jgi:hypothetical protein
VGTPKPPAGLSREAQRLFHETREQFALDDAPSLVLLGNACRALDRLRLAEAIVKKEGSVYLDRFNQPKSASGGSSRRCREPDVATFATGAGNLPESTNEPFVASGGYLTCPHDASGATNRV